MAIGELSVRITDPMDMKKLNTLANQFSSSYLCYATHPNVAADPAIYCPNVLMTPLGPAPNLMIFVAPEDNK